VVSELDPPLGELPRAVPASSWCWRWLNNSFIVYLGAPTSEVASTDARPVEGLETAAQLTEIEKAINRSQQVICWDALIELKE